MSLEPFYRLSRYVVATTRGDDERGGVLVFSTRSCRTFLLSAEYWSYLTSGDCTRLPPNVAQSLVEARVLVEGSASELDDVLRENVEAIAATSTLEQVIQPTAACQLGCHYCGQQHSPHRITPDMEEQIVARVRRRLDARRYDRLNVGWFGGEPLLGLASLRRLSPALQRLSREAGADYSAHIVTNGLLLTPEVARELEGAHRVGHIEVTLDGPRRVHDSRRMTKAGRGSYDRILRNLRGILDDDRVAAEITLRCNVDSSNAAAVPELVHELGELGFARRFRLYFSPVYDWGNSAGDASLSPESFAAEELGWLGMMYHYGFDIALRPKRKKITCIAVLPRARVIDAFGDEYNCTEVPYVPQYRQSHLLLAGGEPTEQAPPPRYRDWNERIGRGDVPCTACRMLPMCGGACPKAWSEGAVPCPSFKHNLGSRLVLSLLPARGGE
ncbi:radical SAM protein [Trujillonella humicola]|uniref:radical SAM protein n=1 Tax=Trujillonella humicola TaxID=3383699 RepID=UPI003905C733